MKRNPERGAGRSLPDRGRLTPAAIPSEVLASTEVLRRAGGQAFLVGGGVRDLLLGRRVRDWDLATDLLPDRLAGLFPKTHSVGAHFGTVLVVEGGAAFEVTTFRRDGVYTDGRHPDTVEFTRRVEEDLARRDFTVNAMAYDPHSDRLLDPCGGLADLRAGVLRTVGDPVHRFREDGLRLLRAVRLACQLDLTVEIGTYRALVLCSPQLEMISAERIREEFERLLEVPHPAAGLDLLHETGLLRRFLPELAACYGVPQNPHHAYDVFHHSLAAVDQSPADNAPVRLAALFHDLGKPETRRETEETATFYGHQVNGESHVHRIFRRLRFPTEERKHVAHLVHHHMFHYSDEWSDSAVRRFLRSVGPENVDDLFLTRAADTRGNGLRQRLAPELEELRRRIELILEEENALHVRDLAVGGHDLMRHLGIGPGPALGRLLDGLLAEVLENPEKNERGTLLALAETLHRRTEEKPEPD